MGNELCGSKVFQRRLKTVIPVEPEVKTKKEVPLRAELLKVSEGRSFTRQGAADMAQRIIIAVLPLLASQKTLTIDQIDKVVNDLQNVDWYVAIAACFVNPQLGPRDAFQIVECFQYVCTTILSRMLYQREQDSKWATDLAPVFGKFGTRTIHKHSVTSIHDLQRNKGPFPSSVRGIQTTVGRVTQREVSQAMKTQVT